MSDTIHCFGCDGYGGDADGPGCPGLDSVTSLMQIEREAIAMTLLATLGPHSLFFDAIKFGELRSLSDRIRSGEFAPEREDSDD